MARIIDVMSLAMPNVMIALCTRYDTIAHQTLNLAKPIITILKSHNSKLAKRAITLSELGVVALLERLPYGTTHLYILDCKLSAIW